MLLTRRLVFRFLFLLTFLLRLLLLRLVGTVRRWLTFLGQTVLRWWLSLFARLLGRILLSFSSHASQVLRGIVMNRLSDWFRLVAHATNLVPRWLRIRLILVLFGRHVLHPSFTFLLGAVRTVPGL